MTANEFKILLFILTICFSAAVRAQPPDGSPATIERVAPNATLISTKTGCS